MTNDLVVSIAGLVIFSKTLGPARTPIRRTASFAGHALCVLWLLDWAAIVGAASVSPAGRALEVRSNCGPSDAVCEVLEGLNLARSCS